MAKIAGERLQALARGLMETLKARNLHPFMVKNDRHAWDVFHKAWQEGRIDGKALYADCNDAHIQTALRSIFKGNA